MKMPTLDEVHPPFAAAKAERDHQNERIELLTSDTALRNARIQSGKAEPGNQEENRQRAILGQPLLPEILSDQEKLPDYL